MPNNITEDPTTVNDAAPRYTLGDVFQKTILVSGVPYINKYRYVQFKDAVTYAAGQSCTWANATATAVTNDRSGGSSIGNQCAGVALLAVTQNYYGFVQTAGYHSALVTNGDDDIAAGVPLVVATGTDGACDSAADPNPSLYFADALAADVDAANTVAGLIHCLAA